jgi:hypothetical protein
MNLGTVIGSFPGRDWDYYFSDSGHGNYFQTIRKTRKNQFLVGREGPCWTEADELALVNTLSLDWFGEPWGGGNWSFDDLNLDKIEAKPLRKKELPPFKINYDTYPEIKLRLLNTVISIKGHPFLVCRINNTPDKGYLLAVNNGYETYSVAYNDLTDLRTIPPMYVSAGSTGWLCRIPGRVYQQGLNRHNTILKTVDGSGNIAGLDVQSFVKAFQKRSLRKWDSTLKSFVEGGELPVMRSVR